MTSFFTRFRLTHIITGLCIGFILISAVAITSSYLGYRETDLISDTWADFDSGPSQKDAIFHDLHTALGFGGMIHQFKNYVIRQDAPRLEKIRTKINAVKDAIEKYSALSLDDNERAALKAITENILAYEAAATTAELLVASGKTTAEVDNVIKIDDNAAIAGLTTIGQTLGHGLESSGISISASIESLHEELSMSVIVVLLLAGVLTTTAFFALKGLYRQLGTEPADLRRTAEAIATGDLDFNLGNDESRAEGVFKAMIRMRENLRHRIQEDQQIAQENGRIKQALENSSGSLMITDAEGTIIYINTALKELLGSVANDMRKTHPSFNTANIVGSSFDQFHKQAGEVQTKINSLKSTYSAEMPVCSLQIKLIMNPVWGENNSRLGTVIEWIDRTQEVATEDEIQHIVNSAKSGDLGQRICLEGKHGFFARLSTGVNEMVDVSDRVVNDTASAINAMSNGNLTHNIEGDYDGDFAKLQNDVNTTIDKLTEVMGSITASAHAVLAGTQEIAKGNKNLSNRTQQQSSNLEETASSMEEMTSTVRQNAQNALQANKLASDARQQAEQGGNVVNKAVSAMSDITDSSNKISAIIGVIDEIAFQTNLLALNAAVEAARAGEQGRGFAVVASEVRNLAGRSAIAANEIKGLIQDSVKKVEEGSKLVDESGQTLEEIVSSVQQVSDIIANIASASQEQSEGIDQVNRAISQIDEVTQQNTSLVEEAATASTTMGEQARNLNKMVGFFKTNASSISAATSCKQTAPKLQASDLEERRTATRPWTDKPVEKASPKPATPASKVVGQNHSSDSDWEEF